CVHQFQPPPLLPPFPYPTLFRSSAATIAEDVFPSLPPPCGNFLSPSPLGREQSLVYRPPPAPGGCTRVGNGGRCAGFGGFLRSSSRTIWIAFSSCGSLPAITSAGVCSTSPSGGTPTF